jgi:hypothetical protein
MREIHKTRIQAYKYMDMPPNNETWQWEINFELAFILYIMEKPHTHIYIYYKHIVNVIIYTYVCINAGVSIPNVLLPKGI